MSETSGRFAIDFYAFHAEPVKKSRHYYPADRIDRCLQEFNVRANVADYLAGPVITCYELALEPGVKSSTISSLASDICRKLMVETLRIVDVVPGTSFMGIEVPNAKRKMIMLGSLMFFLSDLMLLFNVFADVSRVFDILCLVLYYPAEILLAISISYSGRDDKEMGVFRKIFCRIFQQCFHILIPLLPYRQPKILKNMDEVILALKEEKINNILLVTDKSIRGLGLTRELEEKLKSAEISTFVFDDILPNPTTKMVEAGLEIYLKNHCTGAIAFGGGSVMDTAKVILARSRYPKKSIAKMLFHEK